MMIISDYAIDRIREYVYMSTATADPAHDVNHIQRVVCITKRLCKKCKGANASFAEALALLHEMNDDKLYLANQMDEVSAFLQELSLPKETVHALLESIPLISYRKHPTLRPDANLETKIVQDADRIDAIGAIGIARAFAYGGSNGQPLYSRTPDTVGVIQHFDEKLLQIYDLLNTDAAKRFAKKRNKLTKTYYKSFMQELENLNDL